MSAPSIMRRLVVVAVTLAAPLVYAGLQDIWLGGISDALIAAVPGKILPWLALLPSVIVTASVVALAMTYCVPARALVATALATSITSVLALFFGLTGASEAFDTPFPRATGDFRILLGSYALLLPMVATGIASLFGRRVRPVA